MKRLFLRIALLAVIALALCGSASQLRADDHRGGDRQPGHYQHDRNGYWDANHQHHPYIVRGGHHGYWWNHVWIIVD